MAVESSKGGWLIISGMANRRAIRWLLLVPFLVIAYGTYCDLSAEEHMFTLGGGYAGLVFLAILAPLGAYLVWPRVVRTRILMDGSLRLHSGKLVRKADFCALLVVDTVSYVHIDSQTPRIRTRAYVVKLVPTSLAGVFSTTPQETLATVEPKLDAIPSHFTVIKAYMNSWDPADEDVQLLKDWVDGPLLHRRGPFEAKRESKDHSDYSN
jgi:hypothetical protein